MRTPRLSYLIVGLAFALAAAVPALGHQLPSEVPAKAKARKNPVPNDEASIRAGQAIYEEQCLSCHGSAGRGDGPDAKGLRHPPAPVARILRRQTDGALFWKISRGGGQMPSYEESLTEEERWQVIRYMRKLERGP
ncbi:MAG: cytochrome c [Deltaproteobacteria bacterium]|nr:cytochrome c [Deltaproteobacteria bacterium]